MKVAIMQPYFFPYIGYFQLIDAVDKFIVYDDVNYINRGWINRNNILINGRAGLISVPLQGASQNKLIKDIAPVADEKWKNTLLKTIEHNYKKAPFFSVVFNMICQVLNSNSSSISELNYKSIIMICKYLGITTEFVKTSEKYQNSELKGLYRILDICKKEGATHYFNPIGGTELYDRELFRKNALSLSFLKSNLEPYEQFQHEFIPALSILDVLMFRDTAAIKKMLLNYNLE